MKKKILISTVALFAICMLAANSTAEDEKSVSGSLIVLVSGLKNTQGQLMVALFNRSEKFMDDEPYKGEIIKITKGEELVRFDNIPYGDYAVAVLHDINMDGELDKNILGLPTEGYGFSNNAKGEFGPPDWMDASFSMSDNYKATIINLVYGAHL